MAPRYAKKVKKVAIFEKKFFVWNNLNCLYIRLKHHLCSQRQISGRYFSKKKLVIFKKFVTLDMKKVQKIGNLQTNFFCSKQPKTHLYSFETLIYGVCDKFQARMAQKRS